MAKITEQGSINLLEREGKEKGEREGVRAGIKTERQESQSTRGCSSSCFQTT